MDSSKAELLDKLNLISSRYNDVKATKEKMNTYAPEDIYERQVVVPDFPEVEGGEANRSRFESADCHALSDDESATRIKALYEKVYNVPKAPKEPVSKKFVAPHKPFLALVLFAIGFLFAGSGAISAFRFLFKIITFNFDWGLLFTFIWIVIAAIVALAFAVGGLLVINSHKKKVEAAKAEFEQKQLAEKEKYEEKLYQHECEMEAYRQKEQEFINEYWAWRAVYLEHLNEEERIKAQLELDRQAVVSEIERTELALAQAKLDEVNDLIGEDYLPAVDTIISLIQSGRADNIKEAINLYEEILYKERQLQLEKEKEANRQFEAFLRMAAEQARHEEEMEFQREQEEQRQEEERYRRQEEERRYKEEQNRLEQQRAEERRAERRRQHEETAAMFAEQRATDRQCMSCAHLMSCKVRRPNCPSYLPK